MKAFPEVTLVLLILRGRTVFSIFKKMQPIWLCWFPVQQQIVHVDDNNLTGSIQVLVHNLMKLVLSSKRNRKLAKNSQNEITPQNYVYVAFGV